MLSGAMDEKLYTCFIAQKEELACCLQTASMPKEYSFRKHFETKHPNFNQNISWELQKNMFLLRFSLWNSAEYIRKRLWIIRTSCWWKHWIIPANSSVVQACYFLHQMIVQQRMADPTNDVENQFSENFRGCVYSSLAVNQHRCNCTLYILST